MTEKNIRDKYALIKDVVIYLKERHTTSEIANMFRRTNARVYTMMAMLADAGIVIERSKFRKEEMKYISHTPPKDVDKMVEQAIIDHGIVKAQDTGKIKKRKTRSPLETPRRSEYWFIITR